MQISIIDPSTDERPAPLFVPGSEGPRPAFLQLDCRTGEVSFGVRYGYGILEDEAAGYVVRWPVKANLRGSRCVPIAEKLRPLLQCVQDGYTEEVDLDGPALPVRTWGELNEKAQRARDDIQSSLELIQSAFDDLNLVQIWTAEEVAESSSEISEQMTDKEIEVLAGEYADHHADDVVVGCLVEAFRNVRDQLRG